MAFAATFSDASKIIIDEVKQNCEREHLVNRFEFKELLAAANSVERYLIARTFSQIPWNIGSLRVLSVLQDLRILTAKEFLLSLENNDQIQLILNDFLEDEFSLLSNLYVSAHYDTDFSAKLQNILDECIRNLFIDLLQNPKACTLNYMKCLKMQLPQNILHKITLKHVDTVLELHKSEVKNAFANFSTWINEGVDNITFTKSLHKILVADMETDVLSRIFRLSAKDDFQDWKFYLIMLQTIASNCTYSTNAYIKKYLTSRLRQIATNNNQNHMLHLLLTARAATATFMDIKKNLDAYASWYKMSIADMKFFFSSDEFKNICSLLEQCVIYEKEEYYLEVHATITISPPILCSKIVKDYKNNCRFRLSQIKLKEQNTTANEESISIDSD